MTDNCREYNGSEGEYAQCAADMDSMYHQYYDELMQKKKAQLWEKQEVI